MKNVRIFISSPGDVAEERNRAKQVVEQLRRRYAGRLTLESVLWEDLPLQADMSFQEGIDLVLSNEHGLDIALFILWSRLGTPLGALITKEDGTEYRSGTERELDLILRARAQAKEKTGENDNHPVRPDILVYLRADDTSFDERLRGHSTDEKEKLINQKKLVEQFIREEFHDPDSGSNIRAYHSFNIPTTFSQRLRVHLQELLDKMVTDIEGQPIWDIDQKGPPFRGLESFDYEHTDVFFGREDEILEVRQALRQQARNGCAFVLISGASGSGKSSLARAGVLPTLTSYEIDESIVGWRYAVFSPGQVAGDGLIRGLALFLMSNTALPELRNDDQTLDDLTEGLAKDPEVTYKLRIKQALQKAAEDKLGSIRLVLLVDQFEELFTDPRIKPEERVLFVNALDALARSGMVWVMATVRSDFYERCEQLPVLMAMKGSGGQFSVQVPGVDALRRLITEPARLAGLKYEECDGKTLDSVILDDASQHLELLPLLEYLLLELFRARTKDNVLTFVAYENFAAYTQDGLKLGGIRGALAKRAEETWLQVNSSEPVFASVMKSLITIGGEEEESAVRRTSPLANVTDTPEKYAFVQAFIEARLFATQGESQQNEEQLQSDSHLESGSNEKQGTNATVSVAHEALFRVWGKAVNWIEANTEFLRVRAQVAQRMQQGGVLLPGDPLFERARAQLTQQRESFDGKQVLFIEKAIANAERKKKRAKKIRHSVIAGLLLLTLAALGGMGLARLESGKSKKITTETQLREAKFTWLPRAKNATINRIFPQNVLYAGRALSFRGYGFNKLSPEEQISIEKQFPKLFVFADYRELHQDLRQQIEGHIKPLLPIWTSPVTNHHKSSVNSVAFSPDGNTLASGGGYEDNIIKLWDVVSGDVLHSLSGHTGSVNSVAFSPDGKTLASGGGYKDNIIKLWDVASGKEIGSLSGHMRSVNSVVFSPDGKTVASGSGDKIIKLWDIASGKETGSLSGHTGSVASVAFSPDSKTLASGDEYKDNIIKLWDVASGKEIGSLSGHTGSVNSVAFSPDGNTLASGGGYEDNIIKLWDVASGKEIGSLSGHTGSVNSVAFSPDVKTLVSGSSDKTIKLWDWASGKEIGSLSGHGGTVTSLAFTLDGKTLVSGSDDKTIKLWDLTSGKQKGISNGYESNLISVTFSPDGKILASVREDKTIKLWDVASGKEKGTLNGHRSNLTSVAFSPDGKTLASGSRDKTIKLWDLASGKEQGSLSGHGDTVTSVVFNPDGKTLASVSWDDTIKLWDVVSGDVLHSLSGHMGDVRSVAFSPDGKTLASGSADDTIKLWDVASGKEKGSLNGHVETVTSVAFSPDGETLASGSIDTSIKLWDMTTGKQKGNLSGHGDTVTSVVFSLDGKILASGSLDKTIKLWDLASGKEQGSLSGHGDTVTSVAFSPDGKTLASGSEDKTIKLWDIATTKEQGSISGHGGVRFVLSVAFSPNGETLASGCLDNTIMLWWDSDTGKNTISLSGNVGIVTSVTFSPDGNILASGSRDNTIKLWDVTSGKEIGSLSRHTEPVNSVAFSPNGETLASGSEDNTIMLWDWGSGKETGSLSGHADSVRSVAFSPDGKTLASGSMDKTIKLWDWGSGKETGSLSGHADSVCSVAFSPDGKTLASGSMDKTIKLWDWAAGKETGSLSGHTEPVNSVAFSSDGKTLASGSMDKTIKLWDWASGKETGSLSGHTKTVNSVAFSPDGKTLASGSTDTSIKLWDVDADYHFNLLGYFVNEWYEFDQETGDVIPATPLSNLYGSKDFGFLNVGAWTHVGVLQSAKTLEEQNRRLYNHYLYSNGALGALALLDQPMDEKPDATPLAAYAAALFTQDGQQDRARIFFDRLRFTKWGRQNLASKEMIDRLNIDDATTISLKQLLLVANQTNGPLESGAEK
ncbi:MAG: WD40 repeat protein [Desulforhopalus sp.]|jgi:WD40 repeat protein